MSKPLSGVFVSPRMMFRWRSIEGVVMFPPDQAMPDTITVIMKDSGPFGNSSIIARNPADIARIVEILSNPDAERFLEELENEESRGGDNGGR